MRRTLVLFWAVVLAGFTPGCLDPLVSDTVPAGALVRPSDYVVPLVSENPTIHGAIVDNDGFDAVIPLLSGFSRGEQVRYWDMGASLNAVAPIYMLVEPSADGTILDVEGNTYKKVDGTRSIIGVVPGDPGYSPMWQVHIAVITDTFDGQIIASVAALDDAVRLGIVEAPVATDDVVNCPIADADVRLEDLDDEGAVTLIAPSRGYYEGYVVTYFFFDHIPLDRFLDPPPPVFVLRREGGEPLSEPLRGVDMTGDGDAADSNNLLAANVASNTYTGLVTLVDVVVPTGYESIDTHQDEAQAGIMTAANLFVFGAIGGQYDAAKVVAAYPTDVLRNWPIRGAESP